MKHLNFHSKESGDGFSGFDYLKAPLFNLPKLDELISFLFNGRPWGQRTGKPLLLQMLHGQLTNETRKAWPEQTNQLSATLSSSSSHKEQPKTSVTDPEDLSNKNKTKNSNDVIRVLHFCEHFGGKSASLHGVSKLFEWWLPNMDQEHFETMLLCRKGKDKAFHVMESKGLHPHALGYSKIDPRNLLGLTRVVQKFKPDIIHAHGYGASLWARIISLTTKIPVIVHGHANYGKIPPYMYPIERVLGPITRKAIAASGSTKDFMNKKRFIPKNRIEVLYSGYLYNKLNRLSEAEISKIRNHENTAETDFIIGIVGRIVGHKGHLDAFKAVKTLLPEHPNLKVWVLGDGDFMPALKEWIKTEGIEDKIKLMGFRDDVLCLIQVFDLQLFPSHLEGTPNTLFEALGFGNLIVASDADGQAEVLTHEKDALIFSKGNVNEMACHIKRLIENKYLSLQLKHNAKKLAYEFDGLKTIRRLEDLYRELLN